MITDRIGRHEVLLPLLITALGSARSDWLIRSIHLRVGCTLTLVCLFYFFSVEQKLGDQKQQAGPYQPYKDSNA